MPHPKISEGSRVKLVKDWYGDYRNNPVWGGQYGKIVGTITFYRCLNLVNITRRTYGKVRVLWDNGTENNYVLQALAPVLREPR